MSEKNDLVVIEKQNARKEREKLIAKHAGKKVSIKLKDSLVKLILQDALETERAEAEAEAKAMAEKKAAEELQKLELEGQQASLKLEHRKKINKTIIAQLVEH